MKWLNFRNNKLYYYITIIILIFVQLFSWTFYGRKSFCDQLMLDDIIIIRIYQINQKRPWSAVLSSKIANEVGKKGVLAFEKTIKLYNGILKIRNKLPDDMMENGEYGILYYKVKWNTPIIAKTHVLISSKKHRYISYDSYYVFLWGKWFLIKIVMLNFTK